MDKQLNFLYDHKADVLNISAGHPIRTDSIPLDEKIILHLAPTTQTIVGFSIIDFIKRFTNTESPASIPITATFKHQSKTRSRSIKKKKIKRKTKLT